MDKYDCQRLFIRVAQLGSFTAAAENLNLTQSAVSKKIAWLEHNIGFTLFHRNSRQINLTSQGREYLSYCDRLIDEMSYTESRLKEELNQVSGELTLSLPSTMATIMLAKPISQFMQQHPKLKINVSVSDRLVDLIESNIDIAMRVSHLADSNYKARFLFNNRAILVASPEYLTHQTKLTIPSDLAQHRCLSYSLSALSNTWQLTDNEQQVTKVNVSSAFCSDSAEMLLTMAIMGQGITALPSWMVEQALKHQQLQHVLPAYSAANLPMYAVYKASDYQPQRVRAFIDYLVAYFTDEFVDDVGSHL
ncbi:LysR family transcriptional regulator [Shewanella sp. Isolate13]|uniref:LysR family transcriptional regulator n=1 Tax=Shewanella sp. Isolate13 TaxID=2908531 RepID=UPI001EFD07F7|nr:LysR family transcriptional regulator [Shewanella sp. Isolate13]MCG9731510.1 LysR family transcriptional regulator [Shewanella sp. Isolate13]